MNKRKTRQFYLTWAETLQSAQIHYSTALTPQPTYRAVTATGIWAHTVRLTSRVQKKQSGLSSWPTHVSRWSASQGTSTHPSSVTYRWAISIHISFLRSLLPTNECHDFYSALRTRCEQKRAEIAQAVRRTPLWVYKYARAHRDLFTEGSIDSTGGCAGKSWTMVHRRGKLGAAVDLHFHQPVNPLCRALVHRHASWMTSMAVSWGDWRPRAPEYLTCVISPPSSRRPS
jgi:hypothetical protein